MDGTYTTTGSSASIYGGADTGTISLFGGWVYLDAIPANTEIEIIVFVFDNQDSVLRPYQTRFRNDKQIASEAAFYLPYITSTQYDVRVRTTKGSNFELSWTRYKEPIL